mmetsp:Transcript_38707/g.97484  ORF Transcript_38707/g.97484 Transcript_38707/m.97484 type:complete len:583 (+) Transcript_38707:220-1968(+)
MTSTRSRPCSSACMRTRLFARCRSAAASSERRRFRAGSAASLGSQPTTFSRSSFSSEWMEGTLCHVVRKCASVPSPSCSAMGRLTTRSDPSSRSARCECSSGRRPPGSRRVSGNSVVRAVTGWRTCAAKASLHSVRKPVFMEKTAMPSCRLRSGMPLSPFTTDCASGDGGARSLLPAMEGGLSFMACSSPRMFMITRSNVSERSCSARTFSASAGPPAGGGGGGDREVLRAGGVSCDVLAPGAGAGEPCGIERGRMGRSEGVEVRACVPGGRTDGMGGRAIMLSWVVPPRADRCGLCMLGMLKCDVVLRMRTSRCRDTLSVAGPTDETDEIEWCARAGGGAGAGEGGACSAWKVKGKRVRGSTGDECPRNISTGCCPPSRFACCACASCSAMRSITDGDDKPCVLPLRPRAARPSIIKSVVSGREWDPVACMGGEELCCRRDGRLSAPLALWKENDTGRADRMGAHMGRGGNSDMGGGGGGGGESSRVYVGMLLGGTFEVSSRDCMKVVLGEMVAAESTACFHDGSVAAVLARLESRLASYISDFSQRSCTGGGPAAHLMGFWGGATWCCFSFALPMWSVFE